MTKRKKQQKTKRAMGLPASGWKRQLDTAIVDFQQGDQLAAKERLVRLAEQHPGREAILLPLLDMCMELRDWRNYAYYGEQLLPIEQGHDRADTLNNLVYAHMQLLYPVLAYHFAHMLATQHPDFDSIEQVLSFIEDSEPRLLEMAQTVEGMPDLAPPDKLNLMLQHEQIRFYTESGHPQKGIVLAASLLQQAPNLAPVLNNLSLAYAMVGDMEAAMAAAAKILADFPQNAHALSNMVRFAFWRGQFDQAQQYGDRLAQLDSDNPDLLMKQVEAFAVLGDDARVRQAYERAKKLKHAIFPPVILHLAATAYMRQGDEKTAWRLWQEAVKQSPDFEMAQRCLAEKRLPPGERHVPWYWSLGYWGLDDLLNSIKQIADRGGRRSSEAALKQIMLAYLQEKPYLPRLFSYMFERGDESAREFALTYISAVRTPELLQTLYDFGTSQYGTDKLRARALQFLSENHPEILPADRQVPAWINGQQTEVQLLGFEITDEPEVMDLPEGVLERHEAAYDLLSRGKLAAAEALLHEIIAAAPDFPSARHHLAVVYERQGRGKEARALVEETHARFPDYFFARAALAQMWAQERRIEEAKEIVTPLLQRTKLHISEFRALARAQMEIALAADLLDGARSWLSMWQQVDKKNPELAFWQRRVNSLSRPPTPVERFLARRRQKRDR